MKYSDPEGYCEICGIRGIDYDHLHTRGAGGKDDHLNYLYLCRMHHVERHQIGIKTFVKKYNLPVSFNEGFPRRVD